MLWDICFYSGNLLTFIHVDGTVSFNCGKFLFMEVEEFILLRYVEVMFITVGSLRYISCLPRSCLGNRSVAVDISTQLLDQSGDNLSFDSNFYCLLVGAIPMLIIAIICQRIVATIRLVLMMQE